MALLPPDYLEAIIAIGANEDNADLRWTSTGFLYFFPQKTDPNRGFVFLVTNRHVVIHSSSLAPRDLYVRINRKGNLPALELPLSPTDWHFHQTADVAVASVKMESPRPMNFLTNGSMKCSPRTKQMK